MSSETRANLALWLAGLALAISVGHVMMRLTWFLVLAAAVALVVAGVVWWRRR